LRRSTATALCGRRGRQELCERRERAFTDQDRIKLTFSLQRVETWLCCILLALSAIHLLTWYLNFYTSLDIFTIFRIFDFDEETNIPTLFNTALFAISALLMLVIGGHTARHRLPYARHWLFLGLVFIFLAVDEFTSIHETLVEPVRRIFDIEGGFFYLAWVIPAMALVFLGALFLSRFIIRLPQPARRLFVLAGLIYVIGAVGMEMVQGYLTTNYPTAYVTRRMVTFLEEFLEMMGLIVFIRGLLIYMLGRIPALELDIAP
jgi:hypothetical protein